jgi:hypothetical protein
MSESAGTKLPGYVEFEFDLPSALLARLIDVLDGMERGPLSPAHVGAAVPEEQGVYQLFHNDKLVYVGKTDAESGLKRRLERHSLTILSRHRLDVAEMSFKAVRVLVFSAMDLETALINHYKALGSPSPWNNSGFGSNDPGRIRDFTALKADGFDANYPINIDLPIDLDGLRGPMAAPQFLARLSGRVPYTLRHEKTVAALASLRAMTVLLPQEANTMRGVMTHLVANLSPGWQATKLSGRVVLYQEIRDDYPGSEIICRS